MTTAVPLPAGTTLGKSFEYGVDINLGTTGSPDWQSIRRISGVQPTYTPTTQDVQTYDDLGAQNSDVTGWSWSLAFNVQVNRSLSTGLYLPEIEALLARASDPDAKGEAAVAEFRWYHKPETGEPNPNDARQGIGTISVSRTNVGPNGEVENLTVTITGKGTFAKITNPFAGWSVTAPTISTAAPLNGGDGDLITLIGSSFLGTTTVTVDGDPAEYNVVNGATIVIALPVGDAGNVPIIVTNATGASSAFTYARAA